MVPREVKSIVLGADRYLELTRVESGYVTAKIAGNVESDEKYIPCDPYIIKTQQIISTTLSNCIMLYIESEAQLFLLHVTPAQAQAKPEWVSMHREYVKPYVQLAGKLTGTIKVQVFGHVDTFKEIIFEKAMQEMGVSIETLSIVPSKSADLLTAKFDFSKNLAVISEEFVPGRLNPKKTMWSLDKELVIAPSLSYAGQSMFQRQEKTQFIPGASKNKSHTTCCTIL